MATILGTTYLNGCNYQLGYDLLGQNIAGNYSTVRLYGILNVTNNYISWSRGTASVHTASTGIGTYYSKGSYTLISADFNFYHDNKGEFSSDIGASLSTTFVSGSTSGRLTLPTIPRQANITECNNFTDEEDPKLKFSNPGGFTLNARLEFAGTRIQRDNIPNTGNYIFELTEEEKTLLRNKCASNSMTVRYVIATKIDGKTESYWSFVDKTMTIINANPIFKNFSYKDITSKVVSVTGNNQVLVRGISELQITILNKDKMVAQKGAMPKNYMSIIDSVSKSVDYSENDLIFSLGTVKSAGTKKLDVRACDSRNNSSVVSKDIVVYDYSKPEVNVEAMRLNNFETQTTLKVGGTYSKLVINSIDKNTIVNSQYRYRELNGQWSDWNDLDYTIEENKFVCEDVIIDLDNTKSFELEIKVTDNLSETIEPVTIDVGQAIFFISSNKKTCYINGQEILTYEVIDEWEESA